MSLIREFFSSPNLLLWNKFLNFLSVKILIFFLFASQEFLNEQGYVLSRNGKILEFLYNNISNVYWSHSGQA